MNSRLPNDIKPTWFSPIRRLQSVAKSQAGLAILTISILVNENGDPVCWTSPNKILLEPKSASSDLLQILVNSGNEAFSK